MTKKQLIGPPKSTLAEMILAVERGEVYERLNGKKIPCPQCHCPAYMGIRPCDRKNRKQPCGICGCVGKQEQFHKLPIDAEQSAPQPEEEVPFQLEEETPVGEDVNLGKEVGTSKGKGSKGGGQFAPWLHGSDLPKTGLVKAKVMDFRSTPRLKFSSYVVDLQFGGKTWALSLKGGEKDGRMRALVSLLGPRTGRWIGKTVTLRRGLWKSPNGPQATIDFPDAE